MGTLRLEAGQHPPAQSRRERLAQQGEQRRHQIIDRGLGYHAALHGCVRIIDREEAGRRGGGSIERLLQRAQPDARAGWQLRADVGGGRVWLSTLEQPLDAATASPAGFFAIYDPHTPVEGRVVAEATIYDLVPTLLTLLGEPLAPRLRGRVLPGFER